MKLKFKSITLLVEVSYSSVTLVMTISSTPFLSTLGEYLKIRQWEVRKFRDDPASRSANLDQVNKIFSQFQRNLSCMSQSFYVNSELRLKLKEC